MKVLFLSGWFPCPPDNGSKIRVFNLLRALAACHEVTFVSFAEAGEAIDTEALRPYCRLAAVMPNIPYRPTAPRAVQGYFSSAPRSVVATYSAPMARQIRDMLASQPYDLVIASQLRTAIYVPKGMTCPSMFEEVETGAFRGTTGQVALRPRPLSHKLMWSKFTRYLRALVRCFDSCTVVSEQERQNLRAIAPEYASVDVIPNGVDINSLSAESTVPQPDTLVFNGSLTFKANYDAMSFFLTEVWPRVRLERPHARLLITGRLDGVALNRLPLSGDVTLTGYLPAIAPTVAGAWACVAPLRIGGGTRLKILEAMALGTPVVATTKGVEGLAVTPGQDILIADDPADLAAQIVRLLADTRLRKRLATNARNLVAEKYDWRAIGQEFIRLAESVALMRTTR